MLFGVTEGQTREEELTPHPEPQIGELHLQDVSFKEHYKEQIPPEWAIPPNAPGISPLMASYHILGEYIQE